MLIKNNEIALAINKINKTFLLLLIKDFFLRLFKINSFPSKMEYFLLINHYTRYYSFFIIQDNLFSFSIRDLIYLLNNHFINNCIFVLRGGPRGRQMPPHPPPLKPLSATPPTAPWRSAKSGVCLSANLFSRVNDLV